MVSDRNPMKWMRSIRRPSLNGGTKTSTQRLGEEAAEPAQGLYDVEGERARAPPHQRSGRG